MQLGFFFLFLLKQTRRERKKERVGMTKEIMRFPDVTVAGVSY